MKKFLGVALLGIMLMTSVFLTLQAEEEDIIDLYPYDQEACLLDLPACTNLRVGSSFWTLTYADHRYHVVRGGARYAVDFEDLNADGYISADEMGSLSYNAFGSLIINDTDEYMILSTLNARTDLTTVVHRIYTYFDGEGVLQMFEDHIHQYYIFNEGDLENPEWRLATQEEIDAYVAAPAEEKPETTHYTHIRMALDASDPKGYVLEPLVYLQWVRQGVDVNEDPVEEWSHIIEGDPDYVHIPAGWTVFSFGTLDRSTAYAKHVDYIKSLPMAMIDETVEPMELNYDHQPAAFANLGLLDDDLATPGIQIVVDYQADFELETVVTASWRNMFDAEGQIINRHEMLDYSVEISHDGVVLETIDYTYEDGVYTPSGPVTVIDTDVFGAGYIATFKVMTPIGQETTATVEIVVGVMPPKFSGVVDRYITEGTPVDVLQGITADDGYGNDLTDAIQVTLPEGFNPYSPKPGVYDIHLQFIHNIYIPGEEANVNLNDVVVPLDRDVAYNGTVNINGYHKPAVWDDLTNFRDAATSWGSVVIVVGSEGTMIEKYDRYTWGYTRFIEGTVDFNETIVPFDSEVALNAELDVNVYHKPAIWTDLTHFRTATTAWGSVMVVVDGDGFVSEIYDRYNWNYTTEEGMIVGDADHFADWQANVELDEGGFLVAAHGSIETPPLRALEFGDPVSFTEGEAVETIMDLDHYTEWHANVELEEGGFIVGAHGSVESPPLRALEYGDPVSFTIGIEEFDYDIVTETTYTLTVDDTTPPVALIVDPNYTITVGQFTNVNQAILRNVVAFDLYDTPAQLAVYVSNNGGLQLNTPGTYNVQVTVEDRAGNAAIADFTVTVAAPTLTVEMIETMIQEGTLSEEEITALINSILDEQEPVNGDAGCAGAMTRDFTTPLIVSRILSLTLPVFLVLGAAFIVKTRRGL